MNQLVTRVRSQWAIAKFAIDNIGWIFTSLILALIIWIVATLTSNPIEQRQFNQSLEINFIDTRDDGVVLLTSATLRRNARATVTLRAPRSSWENSDEDSRFEASDIEVYADLTNLPPGTHVVQLEARLKDNSPPGRVVSISPPDITIEMVPYRERMLPVQALVSSGLSAEYEYSRPVCEETEVKVSGPSSSVDQVLSAQVTFPLRNSDEDPNHTGQVVLLRASGREYTQTDLDNLSLSIDPAEISCNIVVTEVPNVETVLVQPIITGAPPSGYSIKGHSLNPSSVVVVGDPELLEGLNGVVQTQPVDTTGQTSDFSRTVDVDLPQGVQLRPETTRVTVNVDIEPITVTKQFTEVPIRLVNLDPNLVASSIVPQTFNVTIVGPEPLLNDLTVEDLSVTVNLNSLPEGTHTDLPAQVTILRETVQDQVAVSIQPSTVSVVIDTLPTPTPMPRKNIIGKIHHR